MAGQYPNASKRGSRWDLGRRVWFLIGVIVVLVVLLICALVLVARSGGTNSSSPPASTGSVASSGQPSLGGSSSPTSTLAGIDSAGFVDSHARCDEQDNAVAIGRTAASLVVICQSGPDVSYFYYRGVRLSDKAESEVENAKPSNGGYRAQNGGTTYSVDRDALTISSGGSVLSSQPMLEYVARRVAVDDGSGAQATPEPTETQRPQTVPQTDSAAYPSAPRAAQGMGDGDFRFTASRSWELSYEASCTGDRAPQGFVDFKTADGDNLGYVEIYPSVSSGTHMESTTGLITAHVTLPDVCAWSVSVKYN